jgi:hypothetical protein
MKPIVRLAVVVLCCPVVVAGCSSSGGDVKKVQIALTMEQKPLSDADIRLIPKDDPELGDGCEGRTASDGKVDLKPNPQKPLKPGRYVLLVRKLVRADGTPIKIEEDIAVRTSSKDALFGGTNAVPSAYNDKDRALLIVELKPGDNSFPFDLDPKKK